MKSNKMDDILMCFICLSNLQNPHIAPCCSKLCCYSCITKWLADNRQCPHCRTPLRSQQLVNCRFLEELVINQNDPCPQHNAQLQYYCLTCSEPICSECAMFSGHKMHEFEHIQKVFDLKMRGVKGDLDQVNSKLRLLKESQSLVDEYVDELNRAKDERVQEIHAYTETLLSKLELQHQQRLMILFKQKQTLSNKILTVTAELDEISSQVKSFQKSQTIIKADELLLRVQAIDAEPEQIGGVLMEFQSEVIPAYQIDTFELLNYSCQDDIVYSDHLIHNGIKWRLKIYPHGSGSTKNTYMSIFLEMDSKSTQSKRYEYKIEMINQRGGPNVIRDYSSEFEGGECWGYNRFFRIDLLAKDGYLKDDRLYFKYYVRAPNYFTEAQDQQNYILQLESQLGQQTARKVEQSSIQKLRQEIEEYAEKIEQLDQSSEDDQEEEEEAQNDNLDAILNQNPEHSLSSASYEFDGQFEEIQLNIEQPIRRNLIKRFNQQSHMQSPENRSPSYENDY